MTMGGPLEGTRGQRLVTLPTEETTGMTGLPPRITYSEGSRGKAPPDGRLRLPSLRNALKRTAHRPTEVLICSDRRRSSRKVIRRDRIAWPRSIFYPVAGTGCIRRTANTKPQNISVSIDPFYEYYNLLSASLTSFATRPLPLV